MGCITSDYGTNGKKYWMKINQRFVSVVFVVLTYKNKAFMYALKSLFKKRVLILAHLFGYKNSTDRLKFS